MVTALYSFAHFAVDLGCAFAVFSGSAALQDYLLYNLFAFAMQMPLGLLADLLRSKNKLFALSGIAIAALCCLFPFRGPVFFCLLGLGNGLFHVGGGLEIMNRADGRAAPLGIFVSPGAFGVYFGTVLGKANASPLFPLIALAAAGIGSLLSKQNTTGSSTVPELPKSKVLLPGFLLFAVVVLRSAGGAAALPWKTGFLAFAAVCAVVLGKAAGGFLADRFGAFSVSVGSLGLSAVLFLFADRPGWGLAALLLFNMTMPITLFILVRLMPRTKGFSFGLLTFALFLGFLPSYFGAPPLSCAVMAGLCLLSAALLAAARKAGDGL